MANSVSALWVAGTMGGVLLAILGFFLRQHYLVTVKFIDEVRDFNASTRHQISGLVKDIGEIKIFQREQTKVRERLIVVETKLGVIK